MTTEAPDTQATEVHNAVPMLTTGPVQSPIKFDVTAAAIAKMREHAESLTINGQDDKAGFQAVGDYRLVIKHQRTAVQNKAKALKRPHIDYNREVDTIASSLIDPMKEIEDALAKQEKTYTDERDRLAEEKAKAERLRFEGRLNQIRSSCFKYDAETDTYGFGEVIINLDDLKTLPDEEYAATAELILTTQQKEADRLAEVKRLEDLEKKRIADEQEAERKRIVAENNRLAEERAELQRQRDELDALTLRGRIKALTDVGYLEIHQIFHSPNHNGTINRKSLLQLTDAQFLILIEETIAGNKQREQKRIDDEAAEQLRVKDEAQALKDKQKADRDRQKLLKPDKKQLTEFFLSAKVTGKHVKDLNLPESGEIVNSFWGRFGLLISDCLKEVDAL